MPGTRAKRLHRNGDVKIVTDDGRELTTVPPSANVGKTLNDVMRKEGMKDYSAQTDAGEWIGEEDFSETFGDLEIKELTISPSYAPKGA